MQLKVNARCLYTSCPLCESPDFVRLGRADCSSHALYNTLLPSTINWQRCGACNHIFADGYFTDEALDILFSGAHDNQLPNPELMERDRALAAGIIDKISLSLKHQKGKWLDVGFGNGVLLMTCGEYGFDPVGLDLRQVPVDRMRRYGYEAHCMELVAFKESAGFSVVSMADVLEHMPYPKKALSHAYGLLEPGGVLFVSCPNADSFLWKLLTQQKKNPYWMELEHYHNFGRERLYSLLDEQGFSMVNYGVSQRYRIGMEVVAQKPM